MIAPNASVIGDVVVGSRTSIWPGAVLRGDYGRIRVELIVVYRTMLWFTVHPRIPV